MAEPVRVKAKKVEAKAKKAAWAVSTRARAALQVAAAKPIPAALVTAKVARQAKSSEKERAALPV